MGVEIVGWIDELEPLNDFSSLSDKVTRIYLESRNATVNTFIREPATAIVPKMSAPRPSEYHVK